MVNEKRIPEAYQPPDCDLACISNYAQANNLSSQRIYQLFQEKKLEIVSVDGKQYVKTVKQKL